ncbi:hypothetical protein INT48_001594 [Thamnidium elegans]|uniref:RRM domain-containing protein n=1 Tax=Thamnidium elegans TaxID=101142 RepID=A0A8H7SQ67_9FUNG|nr:hypothetical protein INT48_001594 [Thamnidium elegans]
MAKGNIDLDRSLDDIIKHSKTRQPKAGRPAVGRAPVESRRGGRRDVNNRVSAPVNRTTNARGGGKNIAINRRIGRESVTDKTPPKSINSRLSKGGISKPQRGSSSLKRGGAVGRNNNISSRNDRRQSVTPDSNLITRGSIDPKTLVITKAITHNTKTRSNQSGEGLVIRSNINRSNRQKPINMNRQQNYQQQQQQSQSSYSGYPDQRHQNDAPFNNTASSYPVSNVLPQRNIVLICNLDPRATAEDVGEACSMFGPILSCDILLDPMGRPLNEAEIEFLYPNSAEECVSKLDNGMADGNLYIYEMITILQSSATLPVVPRYSSRTVVASARVAPGGFDNNSQQ